MLAAVDVEKEIRQRALQFRAQIPIERKARPGDLGGAAQVQDAERLPDLPVRPRRKRKFPGLAPAAHFLVVAFRRADRDASVGDIRKAGENLPQPLVVYSRLLVQTLDLPGECPHLLNHAAGILSLFFQPPNLITGLVAPALKGFDLGQQAAALAIHLAESVERGGSAPLGQFALHELQVVANEG